MTNAPAMAAKSMLTPSGRLKDQNNMLIVVLVPFCKMKMSSRIKINAPTTSPIQAPAVRVRLTDLVPVAPTDVSGVRDAAVPPVEADDFAAGVVPLL